MKKPIPVIISAIMLSSCSGSEVSAPAPQPPEEYSRFIIDEHFSLPEDEEVYEYTLAPFTAGENSLSALSAVFFTPDEKLSAIQNGDTLTTEDKQKTLTLLPDGRFEYSAPALDPDEKWTAPVDTVFQNAFEDTTLRLETGSITLELLSRGCKEVVSVEMDRDHSAFIRQCIAKLGVENHTLIRGDVFRFLKSCKRQFQFVFADPPYALPGIAEIPERALPLISEGGFLVLEHGRQNDFSSHPQFVDHRQYGSVNFSIFKA